MAADAEQSQTVSVDGRLLKISNLDKVLYPATGTTKGDVIAYYTEIAPLMIPHLRGRPVTRKRWVHGVGTEAEPGQVFFQKNLDPRATPDWVRRFPISHHHHTNDYPVVDDLATLAWLAQLAALEIHVPQWRFDADGTRRNPDRLVLDLDPGPGIGLPDCAQVALWARDALAAVGLELYPVTSGSKGMHLYARLDGTLDSNEASAIAKELAQSLQQLHPELVVSEMAKVQRKGKVFIDWSQNNASKTTISPYSLRGRMHPTVAAPRRWDELDEDLEQLDYQQLLERAGELGDLLAPLTPVDHEPGPDHGPGVDHEASVDHESGVDHDPGTAPGSGPAAKRTGDRLTRYRSMRDPDRTPEPVPAEAPQPRTGQPTFVIQEHHARRLHYDFRLEHDGVLVSWAVAKGVPTTGRTNHLAVQTEDHPLEYGSFEGVIPGAEYGGGEVIIFDHGTIEVEKWREGREVIVTLNGTKPNGVGTGCKVALIHTGGRGGQPDKNWLMHLMAGSPNEPVPATPTELAAMHQQAEQDSGKVWHSDRSVADQADEPVEFPPEIRPMLAAAAKSLDLAQPEDWAFEMKWDGVRAVCYLAGGQVKIVSRSGLDNSASYPEIVEALAQLDVQDAVLDGEIVAVDERGTPSFRRLQSRINLTIPADVRAARQATPVQLVLFDVMWLNGQSLTKQSYDLRRSALQKLITEPGRIQLPPSFDGDLETATIAAQSLGMEGLVAKRRDSGYHAGSRGGTWLKIKYFRSQEVVIGGWRPGNGRRADTVGSLFMGIPDDDGVLTYIGRVGSGFSDAELDTITRLFADMARDDCPLADVPDVDARDAHWIEPDLVGEVSYGEWIDGQRLRHPVWRGWRPDKSPDQVVVEPH